MPNGGTHNCIECCNFNLDEYRCLLKNISIPVPPFTGCRAIDNPNGDPNAPMYAIVGEVRNGGCVYMTIPYLGAERPYTVQESLSSNYDTVLVVRGPDGRQLRFETVSDYLTYYNVMKH